MKYQAEALAEHIPEHQIELRIGRAFWKRCCDRVFRVEGARALNSVLKFFPVRGGDQSPYRRPRYCDPSWVGTAGTSCVPQRRPMIDHLDGHRIKVRRIKLLPPSASGEQQKHRKSRSHTIKHETPQSRKYSTTVKN